MDSWGCVGVGVWVSGSLVDGGTRGEGRTISWWSAWGERAVIGLRGLEAEVTGGGAGERERENGKMEMGPRRKGLRHSTTAGLARGLGLELAGWLAGLGLGWRGTDVELELGPVDENRPPAVRCTFPVCCTAHTPEYAANTGASVLSVWAHLVREVLQDMAIPLTPRAWQQDQDNDQAKRKPRPTVPAST